MEFRRLDDESTQRLKGSVRGKSWEMFTVAAKERTTLQIFKDVHWAKITILAQAQAVF